MRTLNKLALIYLGTVIVLTTDNQPAQAETLPAPDGHAVMRNRSTDSLCH